MSRSLYEMFKRATGATASVEGRGVDAIYRRLRDTSVPDGTTVTVKPILDIEGVGTFWCVIEYVHPLGDGEPMRTAEAIWSVALETLRWRLTSPSGWDQKPEMVTKWGMEEENWIS